MISSQLLHSFLSTSQISINIIILITKIKVEHFYIRCIWITLDAVGRQIKGKYGAEMLGHLFCCHDLRYLFPLREDGTDLERSRVQDVNVIINRASLNASLSMKIKCIICYGFHSHLISTQLNT